MVEVGDDEAVFATLYPRLRRLAAVAAPLEVDPDDLVQDALVRVLRRGSLSTLDDPGAFLAKVIVNLASNTRRGLGRRRRAWARHGVAPDGETAAYPSDLAELERLGPDERALLFLVDVEGWSFTEAAAALGCTESAARQRASRARRKLRADLGGEA
jgi:RNA polymerase sigma-70 factor (ECF subfamily)